MEKTTEREKKNMRDTEDKQNPHHMSPLEHNLKLRCKANSLSYSCAGGKCSDYVLLYADERDVFICYDRAFVRLRVRVEEKGGGTNT